MSFFEEFINTSVPFTTSGGAGRFRSCVCAVCNDHSPRGGFTIDGNTIGYNCFNCGHKAAHTTTETYMGDKMRIVLNAFGLADVDIDRELSHQWFAQRGKDSPETKIKVNPDLLATEIDLPEDMYFLEDLPDEYDIKELALQTIDERGLSNSNIPFCLSILEERMYYLIIPYFRENKLVYWEGRHFDPDAKKRYISAVVPKSLIIYNFDQLNEKSSLPLFVCEGAFNAMCVNGISICGSDLSPVHIAHLRKSKRDIVFVIEKDSKGLIVGTKALEEGFDITFLSDDSDDVSKSTSKYGKLFTLSDLIQNRRAGMSGGIWLQMLKSKLYAVKKKK